MDINEYEKVKRYTYLEFCNYLKKKYGTAKHNYFTSNWNKDTRVTRTNEGLITHHICEDRAIKLSDPVYAKKNPYEMQLSENLVYADYLEHLFLHKHHVP